MNKNTKIAISLPEDLLQDVERERQAVGESRSEFFRRAVYDRIRRERELGVQYAQGYLRDPETPDELAWVESASLAVLREYPWDHESKE